MQLFYTHMFLQHPKANKNFLLTKMHKQCVIHHIRVFIFLEQKFNICFVHEITFKEHTLKCEAVSMFHNIHTDNHLFYACFV